MYELLNIKWGESTYGTASGPVTWSADLDGLPISDGADLDDIVSSLTAAFQTWEDVAALNFGEAGSGADISISYASFSTDGNADNDDAAGTASWSAPSSGLNEPTNVEIEFNSDFTWSPFLDADPSTVNFYAVALHEIGHVIGLDHPWDIGDPISERDDSLIMNAILTSNSLGDGDIAGAQAIYGLDAGDVPVEDDDEDDDEGSLAAADDGGSGGAGVGILLGLLALVFGLFSGGLGAAAVMAAGTVATEDDEDLVEIDHDDDHDDEDDHGHDHGDGNFHVLYLPTIPVDEFAQTQTEDEEDDVFLL